MLNKIKENWKTLLVSVVTFVVVLLLCCSSEAEEVPVQELSDEEIEKLF